MSLTDPGLHPRPQLIRGAHLALDREAGFAYDDADAGRDEHWERDPARFDRAILLPFAPESPASGIGDTGFHPVVWYRIPVTRADLDAAGLGTQGSRLILHLGAVDHAADVWVDGVHVAAHEGGQVAFSADVTHALADGQEHAIVVRAEDDPLDASLPRGKQDWMPEPHAIWYHRTTGIWRTVWLEAVPPVHVARIAWSSDVPRATVRAEIELSRRPAPGTAVSVTLALGDERLARVEVSASEPRLAVEIPVEALANGQHRERYLWAPEHPRLVDATVTVTDADGGRDEVASYLGIRSVAVGGGRFLLNDHPYAVRSVLEQGYWPLSHFTAPSVDALRAEVELIRSLGFNAARVHQKVEDERFLYWADRLGLLLWGETANAYEFSPTAVERLASEWADIVRRDRSHPCVVTWVPLNESWGVQHIAHDPAQRAYATALAELTRALDPSRPVVSNDGWEHTDSDLLTIHDYEGAREVLAERYGSAEGVRRLSEGYGPAGRLLDVADGAAVPDGAPVMLTEFGGVSYAPDTAFDDSWGYTTAKDAEDFRERLAAVLEPVVSSPVLAGFCYTQLTDTRQETNGLCDEDRVPKLPAEEIARLVRGDRP